MYCRITKISGKLCLQKGLFNLWAEANIIVRNARVCARCAIFFLKIKQIRSLLFGQGLYFFEESPKSIQDAIGDVYCPGKYCSNREECEIFDGYVKSSRSIHGCGSFGAWLFVHKVLFLLQDETDKEFFFNPGVFDISQFQHQIVRVSNAQTKSLLLSSCSKFAI